MALENVPNNQGELDDIVEGDAVEYENSDVDAGIRADAEFFARHVSRLESRGKGEEGIYHLKVLSSVATTIGL